MSILRPEWFFGPDPRLKDLHHEALEGRRQVCTDIDELRTRITASLAAVALTTAVLATLAPKDRSPLSDDRLLMTAVALFILAVALMLFPLFPRNWRYAARIEEMDRHIRLHPAGTRNRLQRWHTRQLQADIDADSTRLRRLQWAYVAGLIVFAADVAVWVVAIFR